MDADLALDRIAFLLERQLASTYRVRAFRRAADTVREVGDDEVVRRTGDGTLESLPGVGATTAEVIRACVEGVEPEYLLELEGEPWPGSDVDDAVVLPLLRGDLHTHSDWSDGGSPIDVMARTARDLGHEYVALTDHSPRLTVANGLDTARLMRQLDVVAAVNEQLAPFRLLTGIEVDILDDGSLDQTDDVLARLDVVVASVHSKLKMDAGSMTRRMLAAVRNPYTDILGHCTGRMVMGKGRAESSFDAEQVLAACRDQGVAVEVNSRPERLDPPRRLLTRAIELGCLLSIDSDAHAPGQLSWLPLGAARAAECGADPADVVTTWNADALLAWTRRARS